MNPFEKKISDLVTPVVIKCGYYLNSVRYFRENGEMTLRIVVDRDGENLSLDDIVKLTDIISPLLDESDLFKDKYCLDITTLGVEKPIRLEALDKYIGKYLDLHLSHPYKGLNDIVGTLLNVDSKQVTVLYQEKARKKEITLPRQDIDKAHLAIKF